MLEHNIDQLRIDLRRKVYRPQPLFRARIPKTDGGIRNLTIPTVRDRVAITAATLVLTPVLEQVFRDSSYGFRPGRSVSHAIYAVRDLYNRGFRWVVGADIDEFFDSVDHATLLEKLMRIVDDADFLELVRTWIAAPVWTAGKLIARNKGLPQGAPISPVLANLYLNELDEGLATEGHKVVRFADDFLILTRKKPKAREALALSEMILARLGLVLDSRKTRLIHFDSGFRFLGHLFVRSVVLRSPNKEAEKWHDAHWEDIRAADSLTEDVGTLAALEQDTEDVRLPRRGSAPGEPFFRTLYLQTPGCVLSRRVSRFIVKKGEAVVLDVPAMKIGRIYLFGGCHLTTSAVTHCLKQKIPVFFLSSSGSYYGVLDSPTKGNVLLHERQFARAGDEQFRLETARSIVRGKIFNCRVLLLRHRRRKALPALDQVIDAMAVTLRHVNMAQSIEALMGHEGAATARHYEALRILLHTDLGFRVRNRRPPLDPVNSLLSFGYSLCFYNLYGLIRGRGLHPYVGSLHALRDGHPALASDILEEFRAPIIDGLVLYLLNAKILRADDFRYVEQDGERACYLTDAGRRIFIQQFERRMSRRILHPETGYSVDWRRAMDLQVLQMKRWILGSRSVYEPLAAR